MNSMRPLIFLRQNETVVWMKMMEIRPKNALLCHPACWCCWLNLTMAIVATDWQNGRRSRPSTAHGYWLIALIATIGSANTKSTTNVMHLTQRNNHANISELLDNLLRGYDNSIRPGFGGKRNDTIMCIIYVWFWE